MKLLRYVSLFILLTTVLARGEPDQPGHFGEYLMGELIEGLIEGQLQRGGGYDTLSDPEFVVPTSDPNLEMCWAAGIKCNHCDQCGPPLDGGWCVSDLENQPGPGCICNYGWTGENAVYKEDTDSAAWGKNRIRAKRCNIPCHYTHHVRNSTCTDRCFLTGICKTSTPQGQGCNSKCGLYNGKCTHKTLFQERCLCCKGWAGPGKEWDASKGAYWAEYCDQECQFLGNGQENEQCIKRPDPTPPCNPKCSENGKCLPNGRCECCQDWTGPNPKYYIEESTKPVADKYKRKIHADYCDVYCPFVEDTHRTDLCVEPDYVKRRRLDAVNIDIN